MLTFSWMKGIKNIVVNPVDVFRLNRYSLYNTDKSDSRMIAEALRGIALSNVE